MSFLVLKEVHFPVGLFGVFLLYLSSDRILETNDEMYLGAYSALVGAKHDRVGTLVTELCL